MRIDREDAALLAAVVGQARMRALREGKRLSPRLLALHGRLAMSASGHDSGGQGTETDTLIGAGEAAAMLGISARHLRRVAVGYGGQRLSGRWLFQRTDIEKISRKRTA